MSFRGRGGSRGGGRGGGGFRGGGRGGGRGGRGGGNFRDYGPPESVTEVGEYLHPCEGDLVCKCTNEKVPYFNAPIFLENKEQVGKIDEIFGPMTDFWFSVKLSPNMNASSFNKLQKLFIDPYKLLPMSRFLPRAPGDKSAPRGRGGGRGGGRRWKRRRRKRAWWFQRRTWWFQQRAWRWFRRRTCGARGGGGFQRRF